MKRTKKGMIDIFYGWVCKAQALEDAGVKTPYINYSIYGGGNYLSMEFTVGDVTFKKKDGDEPDEAAIKAVTEALAGLTAKAVAEIEKRRSHDEDILAILKTD